jgi:hypothetical protein
MGRRSRKARTGAERPAGPVAPPGDTAGDDRMARGYARGRRRDEEARARLEPLAPGERPLAVTIAAIVAAVLALANVAFFLAGWEVSGEDPQPGGVFGFAGILLAAAVGMWLRKYWAVLGFEVLLGITAIYAGLSLLFPSNWQAVVLALVVLVAAGTLFWFLIRAMARIQMPQR